MIQQFIMPKVSFVMPAYKRTFIREAIKSILSQEYRDFELIVVDDASPEKLWNEIYDFFDCKADCALPVDKVINGVRVRYYRNEVNLGGKDLVVAWNKAITYAEGEWIVCAGDDDVYLSNFAKEMVRLSEKYPTVDLVHARTAKINERGEWRYLTEERFELETQIQMCHARSVLKLSQMAPDFMFRNAAFKECGGFVNFPKAWYTDDATWMKLSKNGCAHSSEVLFCFRLSTLNISFQGSDIEDKFKASLEYMKWFTTFVNELQPNGKEDVVLLSDIAVKTRKNVIDLLNYDLTNVPYKTWKNIVFHPFFTKRERNDLIYYRFPRLRALRALLPHF